jgi:hypothetical protein
MSAVHLDGVRALATGERDLELRISGAGVQIYRLTTQETVGALPWTEIRSVSLPRRLSLRRRPPRIEVQTPTGRARFSLPGLRRAQVREHLGPLLARHGVRVS